MRPLSAGSLRVGAITAGVDCVTSLAANVGGSSNTVYSRNKRPRDQLASTRNVKNGSVTDVADRISTTLPVVLPERTIWNSISCRYVGRSRPYRSNVSADANEILRPSSSPGVAESNSISARNGSLSAESSLISPSPRPHTSLVSKNTSASEIRESRRVIVYFSSSPRAPL